MRRSLLGFLAAWLCFGCAAKPARAPKVATERVDVPGAVSAYSTDPGPAGVVGGPGGDGLAREISVELARRGASAVADGELAAAATWMLKELNEGRSLDLTSSEAAARRFGFAGVIVSMAGFPMQTEGETWRDALARVPPNMIVNRFGVSVANSGNSAAVVFGAVELTLAPVPRHIETNGRVVLRGEVGERFSSAHVYLTKPDGHVDERRVSTRRIDVAFSFAEPGKYKLEVMGDGATGPVILFNVPLYVGIEEDVTAGSTGHVTTPTEGEARMLQLLNEARAAAKLGTLASDEELRAIARAHSTDMSEHNFFGHVSPMTGTTEDRARKSGVLAAAYGENVAEADSAEGAFDGLMASPGHRANMLNTQYTHVGIAAVTTPAQQLAFTLIFARRVSPSALPRNAAQVEAAFIAMRAKRGLPAAVPDPLYRAAADAGAAAYAAAEKPTPELAARAENEALAREVQKSHSSRPGGCSFLTEILELNQLEQNAALFAPGLRRFGIGARLHQDSRGSRLTVMIIFEGVACH